MKYSWFSGCVIAITLLLLDKKYLQGQNAGKGDNVVLVSALPF